MVSAAVETKRLEDDAMTHWMDSILTEADKAAALRRKIQDEAQITVIPEDEIHAPDYDDAELCAEIARRRDEGDPWAWCVVVVRAEWRGISGEAVRGGCSYADEEAFTAPGGYYDDMRAEAVDEIVRVLCMIHS